MGTRGVWKAAAVSAAMAATALVGAPAAQAAPSCEAMLPPEDCEKYYYGTLQTVGGVTGAVTQVVNDTTDTAFDLAIWASDTLSCLGWGTCD